MRVTADTGAVVTTKTSGFVAFFAGRGDDGDDGEEDTNTGVGCGTGIEHVEDHTGTGCPVCPSSSDKTRRDGGAGADGVSMSGIIGIGRRRFVGVSGAVTSSSDNSSSAATAVVPPL
jgi:hypothetical protein